MKGIVYLDAGVKFSFKSAGVVSTGVGCGDSTDDVGV